MYNPNEITGRSQKRIKRAGKRLKRSVTTMAGCGGPTCKVWLDLAARGWRHLHGRVQRHRVYVRRLDRAVCCRASKFTLSPSTYHHGHCPHSSWTDLLTDTRLSTAAADKPDSTSSAVSPASSFPTSDRPYQRKPGYRSHNRRRPTGGTSRD